MKTNKKIYVRTRGFRIGQNLDEKLTKLASATNRHDSDLIRHAVAEYVTTYESKPHELEKLT